MSAQNEIELEESSVLSTSASTSLRDSPPHTPLPEESPEVNANESTDVSLLRCKIKAMQEEIVALRDALQQYPSQHQEQQQEEGQQLSRRYIASDKLVAHKYVQLLKKLRNQNVELFVAQNKAQQLTREIDVLKKENKMPDHNTHTRTRKENSKHQLNKHNESKNNQVNVNGCNENDDDKDRDKELLERLQRQLHSVTMHNDLLKRQNNELIEVVKNEVGFGTNYSKEKILQWTRRHCNHVSTSKNTCGDENTVVTGNDDNGSNNNNNNNNNCDGGKEKYIHGWKGRAAQIVLLQSKLKEYEREIQSLRLHNTSHNVEHKVNSRNDLDKDDGIDRNYINDTSLQQIAKEIEWNKENEMESAFDNQTMNSRTVDFDDRTRERLAQMQGNKLAALRDVESQLVHIKDELAQEKNNGKAYQARFSNLQQECVQLRNYVKTLLDKSASDDTLIDAYKTEIKLLQSSLYKAKEEIAFYSTTVEDNSSDNENNSKKKKKLTNSADDNSVIKMNGCQDNHALCNSCNNNNHHNKEILQSLSQVSGSDVMISERDALLLRRVHKLLEVDPTVELTTLTSNSNDNNNSIMRRIVWIAHSHVLRLEEQMQSTYHITPSNLIHRVNELIEQVSRGNKSTCEMVGKEVKSKLVPSVDKFILTENKQLKERIRSLVELNRAEGKVFESSNC